MEHRRDARRAGQGTPTSDKADGANVGLVGEHKSSESPDSHGAPHARQALRVIEKALGVHHA